MSGKTDDAFDSAKGILEQTAAVDGKAPGSVTTLKLPTTIMAYTLSRVTSRDHGEVDKLSGELAKLLPKEQFSHFYGYGILGAMVTSRIDKNDGVRQISEVLRVAPNLDWALWSSSYIALLWPEETENMLKQLPEGTPQRHILVQYRNSTKK
jgi:hypothetical protein